jgi:methanethiol oxidase
MFAAHDKPDFCATQARCKAVAIVNKARHPGAKNGALNGAPQIVEISRDGKRVYFTNSLYGVIDAQFLS